MSELLVHLVRHGQSYNTHRPAGEPYPDNPPLTPVGVAESRRVAERLARLGIDRLVSSPMRRSVETALIVGEATDRLVEVWAGCYEYRPLPGYLSWGARELRRHYPSLVFPDDLTEDDWVFGGESLDHAIARADTWLAWLRRQAELRAWGQMAVVSHGAITRILLSRLFAGDPRVMDPILVFDNTSITTLHLAPGRVRVLSVNDTSHLARVPDLDPLAGVNR
jgi:probable phosphoglycerate mutase